MKKVGRRDILEFEETIVVNVFNETLLRSIYLPLEVLLFRPPLSRHSLAITEA